MTSNSCWAADEAVSQGEMALDHCQLCGAQAKLVKSHIVPKSFYRPDPQGEGPGKILPSSDVHYPRTKPVGIWSRIVCSPCEDLFQPYDTYAAELLLQDFGKAEVVADAGRTLAYVVPEYSYQELSMFFASLLWRASASDDHFFRKVELGPYAEEFARCLLSTSGVAPKPLGVALAAFPIAHGMLDPFRERFDGVNFTRFYLDRFVAYIKVDKRPMPSNLAPLQLSDDSPLVVIARESSSSNDLDVMRGIAMKNRGAFRRPTSR